MSETQFGSYLKSVRERKKISINQLALDSGISNAQISRIENGLRGIPKPETIRKLADALKVPYEEMMSQAGHMPEERLNEIPEWATSRDKRDFKKCWRKMARSCLTVCRSMMRTGSVLWTF